MPGIPCCSLSALSAATSLIVPSAARRDARRPPFWSASARSSCSGLSARCRSRILPICFLSLIRNFDYPRDRGDLHEKHQPSQSRHRLLTELAESSRRIGPDGELRGRPLGKITPSDSLARPSHQPAVEV